MPTVGVGDNPDVLSRCFISSPLSPGITFIISGVARHALPLQDPRYLARMIFTLSRVVLHYGLLADLGVDVSTPRQSQHFALQVLRVQQEPSGNRLALDVLGDFFEEIRLPALLGNGYLVANTGQGRRGPGQASVDQEVAVHHQLPGLAPGLAQPEAIDDVIHTAFEDLEKILAGQARQPAGLLQVMPELPLQDAVDNLGLLLLHELNAPFGELPPPGGA